MTYLKKYGLRLLYTIISILVSILIITTLYYFNIISSATYNILKIVVLLINIFISSFILGKKANNRGYLEGIKLSIMIISILIILSLILNLSLKPRVIIYYLIITSTSIFGSMVGISRKRELN